MALRGRNWTGGRHAPQVVMAPILENGLLTRKWIDDNWDHFINECKFDGFHVPMQGKLPSTALLYLLERCDAEGLWVHLWMYGDQQGGTAPSSLDGDRNHQRAVLRFLAPYKNWSLGLGYDIQEWASDKEVENFVKYVQSIDDQRIVGARRLNKVDGNGNYAGLPAPHAGTYSGYEWHALPKTIFARQLDDAISAGRNRPTMWEERGRVRGLFKKDYKTDHEAADHILLAVTANVASIWGAQKGSQSVSSYGSSRWSNPRRLRSIMKGAFDPSATGGPSDESEEEIMSIDARSRIEISQVLNINMHNTNFRDSSLGHPDVVITGVRIWTPLATGQGSQVVLRIGDQMVEEVFDGGGQPEFMTTEFSPHIRVSRGLPFVAQARVGKGTATIRVRWFGYDPAIDKKFSSGA